MEILVPDTDLWVRVVFIRPTGDRGWEAITQSGSLWSSSQTIMRCPQAGE
jgi:hypothetical protein